MNFKFNAYLKANSGSYKSRKLVTMNLLGEQHIRRVFSEQVIFKQGFEGWVGTSSLCRKERVDCEVGYTGGDEKVFPRQREVKSDLEGPKPGILAN